MKQKADKIKASGWVTITLIHADGTRETVKDGPNLVVDVGLNNMAEFISGTLNKEITDVSFGESATAPAAGDTAPLLNNVDIPITSAVVSTNTCTITATMGTATGNGQTFEEVGLLAADGTLFARLLSGSIAKTAAFSIQVIWKVTFNNS